MNQKRKLVLLSGAMLVMHSLSGCDINFSKIEGYLAPDRRMPEGSDVTFTNRHAPLLNPGNGDTTRQVPAEENSGAIENTIPTVQKTPVVPVDTANIPKPEVASNVPPAASGTQSLQQDPFAPPAADSKSSYPTLASVPQKPEVPPQAELRSNYNSLVAEQKTADSDRKSLMNDKNATVMTSPQTGQVVDNPANAMPAQDNGQAADSNAGFGSWLHNLLGADKKAGNATADNAVSVNQARQVPVENSAADMHAPDAGHTHVATQAEVDAQAHAQAQAAEAAAPPPLDAPPQPLFQQAPSSANAAAPEGMHAVSASEPVEAAPAKAQAAAQPQPQEAAKTDSNDGFGTWMSNIFGSSKKENEAKAEPAPVAAEPQATPAAVSAEAQQPAAPIIEQAPLAPIANGNAAPAPAAVTPAAAPVETTAAAPAQTLPPASALQQNAPQDLAAAPPAAAQQKLPDISQLATQGEERPVNLVQPEYSSAYPNEGYLGDSRYAERMHSTDN